MRKIRVVPALAGVLHLSVQQIVLAQATAPPVNFVPSRVTTNTSVQIPQVRNDVQIRPVDTPQPRTEIKAPLPLNFYSAGTVLPTDTLLRVNLNTTTELGGSDKEQSFGAPSPDRVFAFTELNDFLAENEWSGPIASDDWLTDIHFDDLPGEDSNDDLQKLIPIAYTESIPASSSALILSSASLLRVNKSCRELHIFTDAEQLLNIGGRTVSAQAGTVLTEHPEYSTLHFGSITLATNRQQYSLATKVAGIKAEKGVTCQVEYDPDKKLLVRALSGKTKAIATRVKLASDPGRVIELAAGEELLINLEPVKSREDVETLKPRSIPEAEAQFLIQAHAKHLNNKNARISPTHLIASEGSCVATTKQGQFAFLSGRALIAVGNKQIVQGKLANVYMQDNAIVALEASNGLFRVQCCTDPRSVLLTSQKFGVPMHWGMEAMVVDHAARWQEAFPNDGVARRAFEVHKMNANNCVLSDFLLVTLMKNAQHLTAIRKPLKEQHVDLRDRLLKIAAALQMVTGRKGNYQIKQAENASS